MAEEKKEILSYMADTCGYLLYRFGYIISLFPKVKTKNAVKEYQYNSKRDFNIDNLSCVLRSHINHVNTGEYAEYSAPEQAFM